MQQKIFWSFYCIVFYLLFINGQIVHFAIPS